VPTLLPILISAQPDAELGGGLFLCKDAAPGSELLGELHFLGYGTPVVWSNQNFQRCFTQYGVSKCGERSCIG